MKTLKELIANVSAFIDFSICGVSTPPPRYIFDNAEQRYWYITLKNVVTGKQTAFYFAGAEPDFAGAEPDFEDVIECLVADCHLLREYRSPKSYVDEFYDVPRMTVEEYQEALEKQRRSIDVSKENRTKLIAVLGRSMYLRLMKGEQ